MLGKLMATKTEIVKKSIYVILNKQYAKNTEKHDKIKYKSKSYRKRATNKKLITICINKNKALAIAE